MKKLGLILAVCGAFIGLYAAHADDIGDAARAAVRRVGTITTRPTTTSNANSGTNSRAQNTAHATQNVRGRTATQPRPSGTAERNVSTRATQNVVSRTANVPTVTRTATTTPARTTTKRATTPRATKPTRATRTISRAATNDTVTREDILNRNYSKCKKVFFDCMDEFCANKDAQLKRCACSSRIHEFDNVKKQLAAVEDKMLDFNQRLLTVSMDKEDAAALSVATEGETAYLSTKDTTDSKKQLDAIAKKLNTSFDTSNFNTDLNVLSWSLNADSAFDNVDSLLGASTTTKSGTALYSAALPVCREMAAEVCAGDDLSLAESGYMAVIEQDCNTVAKTYKNQTDAARAKVMEGSALLDMSRLDVYQKRNADDILTCKKKMLDMLTDSTVCGDDMGKCLDVTGQYIDPTTGEAFLTPNLVNLNNLLKRPTDNYTWSTVPDNATFVTFLNSKRKFLEPAMENCQNIADAVWNSFIDDALSQIKLAQDKKLESVRQSCTTLTAQCLSNASESITDFDARALSTFGVSADITASAMCADVLNTCTALLDATGGGDDWTTGITDIATTTTYDTMISTCRQVGQACIIQVCTSTSGNFGLCESIANSTNRKSIINQTACWDEVKDCIRNVGAENIEKIIAQLGADTTNELNFYQSMYSSTNFTTVSDPKKDMASISTCIAGDSTSNCIYDTCHTACADDSTLFDCRVCRLAESIWGNCEVPPIVSLNVAGTHNRIKTGVSTETLLSWFAANTGTYDAPDSCRDTTCGIGYSPIPTKDGGVMCVDDASMCWASYDRADKQAYSTSIKPADSNRCQLCSGKQDSYGNCCESDQYHALDRNETKSVCVSADSAIVITEFLGTDNKQHAWICDGTMNDDDDNKCDGYIIDVVIGENETHHYSAPTKSNYLTETFMSGAGESGKQCIYKDETWVQEAEQSTHCDVTPDVWSVVFNNGDTQTQNP